MAHTGDHVALQPADPQKSTKPVWTSWDWWLKTHLSVFKQLSFKHRTERLWYLQCSVFAEGWDALHQPTQLFRNCFHHPRQHPRHQVFGNSEHLIERWKEEEMMHYEGLPWPELVKNKGMHVAKQLPGLLSCISAGSELTKERQTRTCTQAVFTDSWQKPFLLKNIGKCSFERYCWWGQTEIVLKVSSSSTLFTRRNTISKEEIIEIKTYWVRLSLGQNKCYIILDTLFCIGQQSSRFYSLLN